jgi:hypothetical protein
LELQASIQDPEKFINFIATREPHMSEKHLVFPEFFRECTWIREYRSLLSGDELRYYKNIFTYKWHRVAVSRSLDDKWDSYWKKPGTLIFSRSVNSQVLCEIDVHFSDDYVTMYTDKLRVSADAEYDEEFDKKMANWLLMTKFWSYPFYPFPKMHGSDPTGMYEFILGGRKESVIISDSEPTISDTYQIISRINAKKDIPYVKTLLANIN